MRTYILPIILLMVANLYPHVEPDAYMDKAHVVDCDWLENSDLAGQRNE